MKALFLAVLIFSGPLAAGPTVTPAPSPGGKAPTPTASPTPGFPKGQIYLKAPASYTDFWSALQAKGYAITWCNSLSGKVTFASLSLPSGTFTVMSGYPSVILITKAEFDICMAGGTP